MIRWFLMFQWFVLIRNLISLDVTDILICQLYLWFIWWTWIDMKTQVCFYKVVFFEIYFLRFSGKPQEPWSYCWLHECFPSVHWCLREALAELHWLCSWGVWRGPHHQHNSWELDDPQVWAVHYTHQSAEHPLLWGSCSIPPKHRQPCFEERVADWPSFDHLCHLDFQLYHTGIILHFWSKQGSVHHQLQFQFFTLMIQIQVKKDNDWYWYSMIFDMTMILIFDDFWLC